MEHVRYHSQYGKVYLYRIEYVEKLPSKKNYVGARECAMAGLQQAWAKCIRIHKYSNTFLKVFVFKYFCEKCKVFVFLFKYTSNVFIFMNTFMNTFNIFHFLLIFFTLY